MMRLSSSIVSWTAWMKASKHMVHRVPYPKCWEDPLLIRRYARGALIGMHVAGTYLHVGGLMVALNLKQYNVCHRYSREEPFTALNVDIRNKQHLYESLDAFVKGDLLEGANAYHCEKCDKKVHMLYVCK